MKKESRIKYFPTSFFSIILGMAGFTIAFQKIEEVFETQIYFSQYVLLLTSVLFMGFSIIYLIKLIKFWDEVRVEFDHPIKISFFPTFSIGLLLLSIAFLPVDTITSKYIWIIGTIVHFVFTIKIISIWIQHTKFKITHMNPAWFIPAVGNMLVPIAGTAHASPEISWFFYSIGIFFWIILLIIFFNRIIFHSPLPEKLLPTLFILLAPPAIGSISLVKLLGEMNNFSRVLYYFGLFLSFLLLAQIRMFSNIKFYLSWWAYSFPISAMTTASVLMFYGTSLVIFKNIALIFFILLTTIILILTVKTIKAVLAREICINED